MFNSQRGKADFPIYGVISTGTNWRFLRLEHDTLWVDRSEYFILQLDQILGILCEAFHHSSITR